MKNDLNAAVNVGLKAAELGMTKTSQVVRNLILEIQALRDENNDLRSQIDAYRRQAKWSSPDVDDID